MTDQIQPALIPAPIDRPAEVRKYCVASNVLFGAGLAFMQMGAIGGRNGMILLGISAACWVSSLFAATRENKIVNKMTVGLGKPVGSFTTRTLPMLCAMLGGFLVGSTAYAMKAHLGTGFPIGFVYAVALGALGVRQTRAFFKQVDEADRQLKLKEAQAGPPKGIAA